MHLLVTDNFVTEQGQSAHRTEVNDKSDKQKNTFDLRPTNLHIEEQADRKIIRKFSF